MTLTYNDENVPENHSLHPPHLTDFLKRFRYDIEPMRIRYFAVGEYGEQTQRPHYHLALFGYPACLQGSTSPNRNGDCCAVCDRLRDSWQLGNVYNGQLGAESAAYVASYTMKKMTKADDERLEGRHPEFTRMSLKPGIGRGFTDELASTYLEHGLDDLPDVVGAVRVGSNTMPIGRYLKRALRSRIGRDENTPDSEILARYEEMRPLRDAAFASAAPGQKYNAFKGALIDAGEGRRIQLEHKYRYRKKGTI